METWQSGNKSAFQALFRQYERLVFKNAYLMTGTREDAEDVLQEVFISVWRSRHTFDPEKGSLVTWLHRITVNECLRRRRKKKPDPLPLDGLDPADTRHTSQEEIMASQQEYERLLRALDSLDRKHRAVLVLRYFNDLSYAEIAQAMDIPLGTVKSRINQTLKLLRGRLGGEATRRGL